MIRRAAGRSLPVAFRAGPRPYWRYTPHHASVTLHCARRAFAAAASVISMNDQTPCRDPDGAGLHVGRDERLLVSPVAVVGRRSLSEANSHLYLFLACDPHQVVGLASQIGHLGVFPQDLAVGMHLQTEPCGGQAGAGVGPARLDPVFLCAGRRLQQEQSLRAGEPSPKALEVGVDGRFAVPATDVIRRQAAGERNWTIRSCAPSWPRLAGEQAVWTMCGERTFAAARATSLPGWWPRGGVPPARTANQPSECT